MSFPKLSLVLCLSASAALGACNNTTPPSTQPSAETRTTASASPEPSASATADAPMPAAGPKVTDTLETSAGKVTFTPIYHGTLAIGFQGKTIVVDPYSSAPKGWLPKADLVLITDIHPDHYDPKAIEEVKQDGTIFVAPKVVTDKLEGAKTLANGEETKALGIGIRAVPMYNLKRGPAEGKLYHDKGRGNGYILSFGDKRVYLSGDTACTDEMKALKDIDLAFVCMNLPYTMPPEEAAECIKVFKPKIIIPYHYRGSDLSKLETALKDTEGVKLEKRDFYPGGEEKK
ncbi:MAG: MBL fold metallo-hydrolase [Myxococcales bacterium]|nr:MBL fold metallo-hydrolase [Myxococcales bacterium]